MISMKFFFKMAETPDIGILEKKKKINFYFGNKFFCAATLVTILTPDLPLGVVRGVGGVRR
jgi:hypothetical protein